MQIADVRLVPDLFRQSVFIERSIANIETALRDGALLVLIVLFLPLDQGSSEASEQEAGTDGTVRAATA